MDVAPAAQPAVNSADRCRRHAVVLSQRKAADPVTDALRAHGLVLRLLVSPISIPLGICYHNDLAVFIVSIGGQVIADGDRVLIIGAIGCFIIGGVFAYLV